MNGHSSGLVCKHPIKKPLGFLQGASSGWCDSNTRPPGPKPGAITGLRYIPNNTFKRTLRRGRDSNPRYRFKPVQRFSKPALSATQAPLLPKRTFKGQQKYNCISYFPNETPIIPENIPGHKKIQARPGFESISKEAYMAANCTFCCNSSTLSLNRLSVSIRSFTVWQLWMTVV